MKICCMLLIVVLVWLGITEVRLRRTRRENRQLRQIVEHNSEEMDRQWETMRSLRHDLRHYLCMMGGNEAAVKAEHMEQPISDVQLIPSLLAYYRKQAEELGAQVDICLEMRQIPTAMLPDLCLLLSNLLENAVEALQRENGGCLRVRSISTLGYLTIVEGNTCHTCLRPVGSFYLSAKAENRVGVGLGTVRRIAQQYGGNAAFSTDGSEFRASVFLLLPSGQQMDKES